MIEVIGFEGLEQYESAKRVAEQLHLRVDNHTLPRLSVTPDKLVLLVEGFLPLCVDFSPAIWQKRRDAGKKKQGLIQACRPVKGLRILDVTAGWGRDAAVLASFGAEVLMLERQPVMAALLADGLRRLEASSRSLALSLRDGDAKHYLQNLAVADYPDVIYIDPMHPTRQKSALVKKDMQVLQQLIGCDEDARDLIELAMRRVGQRVVVKWPQREPALLPSNQRIVGKTVCFDIFKPI